MAIIYKKYSNFRGINRSSNNLTGTDVFSFEQENLNNNQEDVVKSRKGYSYASEFLNIDSGILGTGEFIDIVNDRRDLVYFYANGIRRYRKETITLNFSSTHTYAVRANTTSGNMEVLVDSTGVSIGKLLSPVTISTFLTNLATAFPDYTGYTTSYDGTITSFDALTFQVFEETTAGNSVTIDFVLREDYVTGGIFSETNAAVSDDDFEPLSSINLDGCLYISSPYDGLVKFDGAYVQKVSFPQDKYPLTSAQHATINAKYYVEMFKTDAQGNITRSGISPLSSLISSTGANGIRQFTLKSEVGNNDWGIFKITCNHIQGLPTNTVTYSTTQIDPEVGAYVSLVATTATVATTSISENLLEPSGGDNIQIRRITAVDTATKTITLDEDLGNTHSTNAFNMFLGAPRLEIFKNVTGGAGDLFYRVGTVAPIDIDNGFINTGSLYVEDTGKAADIRLEVTDNSTVNGFEFTLNGTLFTVSAGGSATITAGNIAGSINSQFGVDLVASSSGAFVTITRNTIGDFGDNIEFESGSGLAAVPTVYTNRFEDLDTVYYFQNGINALTDRSTLIFPEKEYREPPKCKYVTNFRNQLVISNDKEDEKNTVYYTDALNKEVFSDTDSFIVGGSEQVTGIRGLFNGLYVFKEAQTHLVQGDLDVNKFIVDNVNKFIGCVSHRSIIDVESRLYFMSKEGPRFIDAASNNIKEIYRPIKDVLAPLLSRDNLTKISSAVDRYNEVILFNIASSDTESTTFVFNYLLSTWTTYNGDFNPREGLINIGKDIYGFNQDSTGALGESVIRLNSFDDSKYAYTDGIHPIEYKIFSHFEDLGSSSHFKKFLRFKLFSNNRSDRTGFTTTVKFYKNFDLSMEYASLIFSFLSTIFSKRSKMGNKKITSNAVELSGSYQNEIVEFTGYEYEIDTPHRARIKQ